jgi:hypothetical protein
MTLQAMLVKDIQKDECLSDVNFGVMDMAYELKEKMRGIEFGRLNQKSLWVFRPQDTYAMGFISYGDRMDGGDGRDRYHVFSPNITNSKYSHGDREYMSSALHRAKGVKNAAKYLRPWSTKQVMSRVHDDVHRNAYRWTDELRSTAMQCARELESDKFFSLSHYGNPEPNALEAELKHMLDSGYTFLDKNLEQNLRATFTARREYVEAKVAAGKSMTFVEILTVGDTTHFRGYTDVPTSSIYSSGENAFSYSSALEVPERLMGPMSVLSMVEVGKYVGGVGYRAGDNMFYVIPTSGDE